ncbi:MAG: hypothetical protein WD425_04500 [Nitrospirales bacterium]
MYAEYFFIHIVKEGSLPSSISSISMVSLIRSSCIKGEHFLKSVSHWMMSSRRTLATQGSVVRKESPCHNKGGGSEGIGQNIPHVGLSMRNKPLVDFVGYGKGNGADDSQADTSACSMSWVKSPEQQNAE